MTPPSPPADPPAPLPAPRTAGRYTVALVCLGNICRSPTAAVVLADRLERAGLDDVVEVLSGGTGPWHVGEPMDPRAAATLATAGLDPTGHRGRQVDGDWFHHADLVLAMDGDNLADLRDLVPADLRDEVLAADPPRLLLFRTFDPEAPAGADGADVPDPYYGGPDGFTDVLALVERTCDALVVALRDVIVGRAPAPPR